MLSDAKGSKCTRASEHFVHLKYPIFNNKGNYRNKYKRIKRNKKEKV